MYHKGPKYFTVFLPSWFLLSVSSVAWTHSPNNRHQSLPLPNLIPLSLAHHLVLFFYVSNSPLPVLSACLLVLGKAFTTTHIAGKENLWIKSEVKACISSCWWITETRTSLSSIKHHWQVRWEKYLNCRESQTSTGHGYWVMGHGYCPRGPISSTKSWGPAFTVWALMLVGSCLPGRLLTENYLGDWTWDLCPCVKHGACVNGVQEAVDQNTYSLQFT